MTRTTQRQAASAAANLLNDSSQAYPAAKRAAALLAGLLLASACALRVDASPVRRLPPPRYGHVVRPLHSEDSDGDKINDSLERAISQQNFALLPNAVVRPHSALASIKGQAATSSTVVDMFVCFDHVPTDADTAALTARGFTVENVYKHVIYAVHVVGSTPLGVQTLRDLVSKVPGITAIEPNRIYHALAITNTRQIGARQSWTTYEPHNVTLPLQGDPERSIAVLDTGIDSTHPDLSGGADGHKITVYEDEVSDGTTPIDYIGHGSFVAGIAAGTGQSGGIATGTGYLPMTIAAQNDVIPYANIPIDTTGFTDYATLTMNAYAPTFYPSEEPLFGFITDATEDATQANDVAIVEGTTGSDIPTAVSAGIAPNTVEDLYAYYNSEFPANTTTVGLAIQTPYTAIGDGFNLMAGVAPASELVAIRAGDNYGSFSESSVITGLDFVSANASNDNIGVLNMSFGLLDTAEATDQSIDTAEDTAVDSLVDQGIVCVAAAGNAKMDETAGTVFTDITSPGDATNAITVAAVDNDNQITDYSSISGPVTFNFVYRNQAYYDTRQQEKPDVAAPGGSYPAAESTVSGTTITPDTSTAQNVAITSVDNNFDDATLSGSIPDVQANDYTDDVGTSFSAPHVAGSAALLEQAFTLPGAFGGQQLSGADEAYSIKALLEMTGTKPPAAAAAGTAATAAATNTIDLPGSTLITDISSSRDTSLGYGKINTDAALGAVLNSVLPGGPAITGTFGAPYTMTTTTSGGVTTTTPVAPAIPLDAVAPEAYAANVTLTGGQPYTFTLTYGADVGTTVATVYQLYLYSSEYSFEQDDDFAISSGSNGDPLFPDLVYNTTNADYETAVVGEATQAITYTPPDDEVDVLVVKRIAGNGTYSVASTGYTATNLAVTVTDATTTTPIAGAEVVATGDDTGLQYNQGPTITTTTTTGTGSTATTTTSTGLSLPVPTASPLTLSTTAFGYYGATQSVAAGATQSVAAGATAAAVALTPSHVFSTLGLQMISVPMGYSGQTIAQITLPQLDTAAVWQPTLDDYAVTPTAPADTFTPGQGYWVRLKQQTSINIQGTTETAGTVAVPLQVGWNMIGSPYATPNSLGSATVTLAAGTSESFAAANSAGVVGPLYSYDSANNVYDTLGTSDPLTPYLGYWVYAYQACSLNISGS